MKNIFYSVSSSIDWRQQCSKEKLGALPFSGGIQELYIFLAAREYMAHTPDLGSKCDFPKEDHGPEFLTNLAMLTLFSILVWRYLAASLGLLPRVLILSSS